MHIGIFFEKKQAYGYSQNETSLKEILDWPSRIEKLCETEKRNNEWQCQYNTP